MKVLVASLNPVKVAAAKQAFAALFPDVAIAVSGIAVESGVSEQPRSDEETRLGARGRVENATRAQADADYWVGMEGGIQEFDGQLMAFAWMAVRGRGGDFISEARSATLPLPPAVRALIAEGLELGEANDRVFSTTNSKQQGGAYGLLTDGLYTRESVYLQTLVLALVPFVNPLYPSAKAQESE